MKIKKCGCSDDLGRDVLEIVNYVQIFLIALVLLSMMYVMLSLSQLMQKRCENGQECFDKMISDASAKPLVKTKKIVKRE